MSAPTPLPSVTHDELLKLIRTDFSTVHRCFSELKINGNSTYNLQSAKITHKFFCPILGPKGKPNIDTVASVLAASTVLFALSTKEHQEYSDLIAKGDHVTGEAIAQSGRKRFRLYAKDAITRNGEIGEILLFLLLQAFLGAPKIASKMSLKTSANMHVHGADALHASIGEGDKLYLILGESKFYASHKSGLSAAVKSILEYHSDYSTQALDANIIKNFMPYEVLDPSLQLKLLDYFGTLKPKAHKVQKQIMILVGCNEPHLFKDIENLSEQDQIDKVTERYKEHAKQIIVEVQSELNKFPVLLDGELDFGYLLIPFELIAKLRIRFLGEFGIEAPEESAGS